MIDILQQAAKMGGSVLLKYFRQNFQIEHKTSHQNIVTNADRESQQAIKDSLIQLLGKKGITPDEVGFIAEENLHQEGAHTFIIDPLDGTTNFSVGLPFFCIPICYFSRKTGRAETAVVYYPTQDIWYVAERGQGAYKIEGKKKTKLHITPTPLDETVVIAHFSSNPAVRQKEFASYTRLHPATRSLRNLGVLALEHCFFAENIFGAVIGGTSYIWDNAATKLIIEESGGVLCDWTGRALDFELQNPAKSYNTLACHPKNVRDIVNLLHKDEHTLPITD